MTPNPGGCFPENRFPSVGAFPNVLTSPHDSAASSGKRARVAEFFLHNLERWARHRPLENEVHRG